MKNFSSIAHMQDFFGEEWKIHQHPNSDPTTRTFTLATTVTINAITKPLELAQEFMRVFESCPLVSHQFEEFRSEIKSKDNELNLLQEEINRLKVFENHYNIEMKLRHGAKNDQA